MTVIQKFLDETGLVKESIRSLAKQKRIASGDISYIHESFIQHASFAGLYFRAVIRLY